MPARVDRGRRIPLTYIFLGRASRARGCDLLIVASSPPGEQGHVMPAEAKADLERAGGRCPPIFGSSERRRRPALRRAGNPAHGRDRSQRADRLHGCHRRHALHPPRRRQDRQELCRGGTRVRSPPASLSQSLHRRLPLLDQVHDELIDGGVQLCIAWVTAPPVAVRPPSMTYCAPVIAEARSEHRKRTVLAISSGLT